MNNLKAIPRWVLRAWPLLWFLFLVFLHFAFLHLPCISEELFCWENGSINKSASLILQVSGGALVIYSIDSNIAVFKGNRLKGEFINYLKEFPLRKKHITLQAESGNFKITGHPVSLTATKNPKSIEEHIEYLQEQINSNLLLQQNSDKELKP